jgi:flagellar hook-associated protein 2
MVTKLVDAEKAPATSRLDTRKARIDSTISALGTIKSNLSDLQSSLTQLKYGSYFDSRTTTSSDSTLFTASASASSELGSFQIDVVHTAKSHKIISGDFASATTSVGQGKLTISAGGGSFNIDVSAGHTSLTNIRDAINNAADNSGVRASILTVSNDAGTGTVSKLVLTATKTGAANGVSVTVTGDSDGDDNTGLSQLASSHFTQITKAQDAEIKVDGFAVSSSSNTFTDVISGVTINVLRENSDPDAAPLSGTLTTAVDSSKVAGYAQTFVDKFNALTKTLNDLTKYDSATKSRGLLGGDASVAAIESRLRGVMAQVVSGAPANFNTLAFAGIGTNRDGTLSLDTTKLNDAIENRLGDLGKLFSGDNGAATKLDSVINDFMKYNGVFSSRQTSLQSQLSSIDDDRTKLSDRMSKLEKRYRAQFANLDSLVSQLSSTGTYLTQQLTASAAMLNGKSS